MCVYVCLEVDFGSYNVKLCNQVIKVKLTFAIWETYIHYTKKK